MSFGNSCVVSLYKPTTTLQPKVLGLWCTLGHCLFPKAMDNQPVALVGEFSKGSVGGVSGQGLEIFTR